jgi:hypothetical protein
MINPKTILNSPSTLPVERAIVAMDIEIANTQTRLETARHFKGTAVSGYESKLARLHTAREALTNI